MPYSTKLPEGNRAAFSPTVTLGWNLAKENFLENSVFDNLMLTASAGIINQDLDIKPGDKADYVSRRHRVPTWRRFCHDLREAQGVYRRIARLYVE